MPLTSVLRCRTRMTALLVVNGLVAVLMALALPASPALAAQTTFSGNVDAGGTAAATHQLPVSGRTTLRATLTWGGSADLDLYLKRSDGKTVALSVTSSATEAVLWVTPGSGTYAFTVKALTGSATYSLVVSATPFSPAESTDTFTGTLAATAGVATFPVAVGGPGLVVASLNWPEAAVNLNVFLRDASGAQVAKATNPTEPEIFAFDAPAAGNYSVLVQSASGGATFTLRIERPGPASAQPPIYSRDLGRYATAEISPVDMQKDRDGNWWVLDEGLACVKKYAPDLHTVLLTVFTCGSPGSSTTMMSRARGLGIDRISGAVWVADTSANRLLKLASDGSLLVNTTLASSPGGALNTPGDVAVDDNGNAYVHDQKDRIIKVSPSGGFLLQFGSSGKGVGQMRNIMSIEYSAVGGAALYVTDARNFRVVKWSTGGTWLGSFGSMGSGNGQLTKDARGIAVDGQGHVYVADIGGNRIVRFSGDGSPLSSLGNGLPYNHSGPLDLAYGARGLYIDGNRIAVADMWNNRTLFWTLNGASTAAEIGGTDAPWDGHLEPRGVVADAVGNVYVSDYWHQWIQKFSPDGSLSDHWGAGRGSDPGTLNLAAGLAVDNTRGYLYIANRENRNVDRWRLSDGAFDARFVMPAGPAYAEGWPRDVAVEESTGRFFVADEKNHQVVMFSGTGSVQRIITTWGAGSKLGTINSVAFGPDGKLYVADATNRRIDVYTAAGDYLIGWSTSQTPAGIEVTSSKVFVLGPRVTEYSLTGTLIQTWGTTGDLGLNQAYGGIAITPSGQVAVADTGNHRVKIFQP